MGAGHTLSRARDDGVRASAAHSVRHLAPPAPVPAPMADYLEDPYADPARQQRSSGTKRRRKKSGEDDEDAGARVKPVGPKRAMDGNGMLAPMVSSRTNA